MKAKLPRGTGRNVLEAVSNHQKFKVWQSRQNSAVILIKGDYRNRHEIQALSIDSVKVLRQQTIPVVWALKLPHRDLGVTVSVVDIIKDLIHQCVRLNLSKHSERSMSLSCARFQAAETPAQWMNLLASTLESLSVLYLVINIEAVDPVFLGCDDEFSWLSSFACIAQALSERQAKTRLKVLLLSHGSASIQEQDNLFRFRDQVIATRTLSVGEIQSGRRQVQVGRRGRTFS